MTLAILINFCTNDYPFLRPCLESAMSIADQVIVSVADHFFNGEAESRDLLIHAYLENPECEFLEYAYEPDKNFYGKHPVNFWHNWGRVLGFCHLKQEIEWVLFLDVDEIIDIDSFRLWFQNPQKAEAMRLASYWYFREPIYRARQWEDGLLLAKRSCISNAHLMHPQERIGTFYALPGAKLRHVTGMDGRPMVHHYSWVGNKERLIKKVITWGHRHDAPWQRFIKQEFSHSFAGTDFVHGYEYDSVPCRHRFSTTPSLLSGTPGNVRFISTHEMHMLELLT